MFANRSMAAAECTRGTLTLASTEAMIAASFSVQPVYRKKITEFIFVSVRIRREKKNTYLEKWEYNSLEERTRLVQAFFQRLVVMRAQLAGLADVLPYGVEDDTLEVHARLRGLHV